MKVLAQPIEMISYTNDRGEIRPIRFRIQTEDGTVKVIKIDKVMVKEIEKLAGNQMIVFNCQSVINNDIRRFEIKYELKTCKWILFKI